MESLPVLSLYFFLYVWHWQQSTGFWRFALCPLDLDAVQISFMSSFCCSFKSWAMFGLHSSLPYLFFIFLSPNQEVDSKQLFFLPGTEENWDQSRLSKEGYRENEAKIKSNHLTLKHEFPWRTTTLNLSSVCQYPTDLALYQNCHVPLCLFSLFLFICIQIKAGVIPLSYR